MKDAKSLLLDVLAAIPDGKRVASLFAVCLLEPLFQDCP
jgi:hypothetical protein